MLPTHFTSRMDKVLLYLEVIQKETFQGIVMTTDEKTIKVFKFNLFKRFNQFNKQWDRDQDL